MIQCSPKEGNGLLESSVSEIAFDSDSHAGLKSFLPSAQGGLLGPENESTLDIVNNLGVLYADQGKLAEAEWIHERALLGKEKVLAAEHTSTVDTINEYLGLVHKDQGNLGDLTEAERMYHRQERDDSEAESDISDVQSVFSVTHSIASSESTNSSKQAYRAVAADQLAAEFLKEDGLKTLYEVALLKLGNEKFTKNHDTLLKELLIALRHDATGNQLEAVRVLRTKDSRTKVTIRIVGLLDPTNLSRRQALQDFHNLDADRHYSLNQLLKQPVEEPMLPGSTREMIASNVDASHSRDNGNILDKNSEKSEESEEESGEESEEYSGESLEPIDAVLAFIIKGEPFLQFKASLQYLIHPPGTLQEALDTRHLRTIQKFLRKKFYLVANDKYVWLHELREAGYSWHEMAELLLEEADYAPWIPFEPSQLGHQDVQFGTHLPQCIHQVNSKNSVSSLPNLVISTEDLLRKNEKGKRAVQELCGLAGISPMSRDTKDWNGDVTFEQDNTHASVCYISHAGKEPDFDIIVYRIKKALEGFYEAFSHIQKAGLCCDSFTILLNLTPTSASNRSPDLQQPPSVELWRVDLKPPLQLREALKHLSVPGIMTQDEAVNCRIIAETILEPLLRNTRTQSVDSSNYLNYTLHLCALVVQFLCLGLFSYSQAHVGAIHPFFLDTPQRSVILRGTTVKYINLVASLKTLTCFGDMLKRRAVLTFSSIIEPISGLLSNQGTPKYDLMASPEDILDTWGPGRFIYCKGPPRAAMRHKYRWRCDTCN